MIAQQNKIKNFIKLINKIHSKKRVQPYVVVEQFYHDQAKQNLQKLPQKITISLDQTTQKKHLSTSRINKNANFNLTNQVGIFFTHDSIKQRYDDKKTLYDIYRQSLQKKKDNLHHLLIAKGNKSIGNTITPSQNIKQSDQIKLLNQERKTKMRRQSYTYQRILKKKSNLKANCSIPILAEQLEKKSRTENKKIEYNTNSVEREERSAEMRVRKLNYKPMFRVKRIALQNYKTELCENADEKPKFEKYSFFQKKKCSERHIQTQPQQKKLYVRERLKQAKKRSKINMKIVDKFTAWDSDQIQKLQDSELISKFLI